MKRKILVLVLAVSALLLTACGESIKTFDGGNGVHATASSAWKKIEKAEDLQAMFDSEDSDTSKIDLALAKKSGQDGYFVMESYNVEENLLETDELLTRVQTDAQVDKEGTIAYLKEYDYTDRELELMMPLLDGETLDAAQKNALHQEILIQEYLYGLSANTEVKTEIVGFEDVEIDGHKTQTIEMKYKNNDDVSIAQYEAYVLLGNTLHRITAWSDEETFEKNREEYKAVILSATMEK